MIRKILLLVTLVTIPTFVSGEAEARDNYCREYTKSIRVGGKTVQGYGTACRQPDGAWEITKVEGHNRAREKVKAHIYDDLKHRHGSRVVIHETRHHYDRPSYKRARHFHGHYPYGHYKKHHYKKHAHKHFYKHAKPTYRYSRSHHSHHNDSSFGFFFRY